MGSVKTIDIDKFPKQGEWLGKRAKVCFNYNTNKSTEGTYVRDDSEEPFVTIIKLDDGRYVLSSECQHQPQEGELK